MKKLVVLGLLFCGSGASAQFIITGQPVMPGGVTMTTTTYGITPAPPTFGFQDGDITPTTQRQREARARLVAETFPNLDEELAQYPPSYARRLYARAEKRARWAKIRAEDRAD